MPAALMLCSAYAIRRAERSENLEQSKFIACSKDVGSVPFRIVIESIKLRTETVELSHIHYSRDDIMRHTVGLILGGGKGTRLMPLTEYRSKPAVPLGGKYRLIDVPISNCINSSINRMYVLTQFNSVSLHRHIRQTYNFDLFHNGFVEILKVAMIDLHQGSFLLGS